MFEMEDWESSIRQDREVSLMSALRSSVSFGRFVSESLDWGKWSSFHHNRYLEDAEKYSVRGSVAQKKAYFEAHYKKKLAKQPEDQADSNCHDKENRSSSDGGDGQIEMNSPVQESSANVISNLDDEMNNRNTCLDEQNWSWDGENLRMNSPVLSRSEFSPPRVVHDIENGETVVEEDAGKLKLSDEPPLKEIPANNKSDIENVKKKAIETTFKSTTQYMKENKSPSIHKISGDKKKFVLRSVRMSNDYNQPQNRVISPSLSKTSSVLEKVKAFTNLSRASQECSRPVRKPSSNAARDCSHKLKTPVSTASKVHPYSIRSSAKGSFSGEKKIAFEAAPQNSSRTKTTRNRIVAVQRDEETKLLNADSQSIASRKNTEIMQHVSSSLSVLVDEQGEKTKQLCGGKDSMVAKMAKRLQIQAKEQAPLKTPRSPVLARKNNKETTFPSCSVSSKYCGVKFSGRPNSSPIPAVWK